MTNYSRSVLLSNGLHHSENLPVKFGFSPKSTSTNIAKKLLLQRCSKPLFSAFFNFSHKRPTFAFTSESGYTLAFANRIAHSGLHAETGGRFGRGWYHYSQSVPHVSETLRGQGVERQTLPLLGLGRVCSRRTQRACGTAMRSCASLSRGVAAPLGCVIPWLFPSPHRWVSRFSLVTAIERREHICRFHTLVCSMRLATC